MAVFTIIGWYGTETIGDRAILGGILSVCSQVCDSLEIYLGSLFPVYTERALAEDDLFYRECVGRKALSFHVFDVRNCFLLRRMVRRSDLLIMGGGPLMDLKALAIIHYAFMVAKSRRIKTMLCGCGWGPLNQKEYVDLTCKIIALADHVVMRDLISKEQVTRYAGEKAACKTKCGCDPALIACQVFRHSHPTEKKGGYVAINFRDMRIVNGNADYSQLSRVLENVMRFHEDVRLVPMHSFCSGGDDRYLFHHLKHNVLREQLKITIYDDPPSLSQVMDIYQSADYCIGMRFHSILLQLALNGAVWVLDYTSPETGKIIGLLKLCGFLDACSEQYRSLVKGDDITDVGTHAPSRFAMPNDLIDSAKTIYVSEFESALK